MKEILEKQRPTNNLSVLIVTSRFPPDTGGASVYFSNLINSSKEKKIVFIVLSTLHKGKPIIDTYDNTRVFRIVPKIQKPALLRRILSVLVSFLAIFLIWVVHRPSILHCHCGAGGMAFSSLAFSSIFRLRVIKDVRGIKDVKNSQRFIKLGRRCKYLSLGGSVNKELVSLGIPEDEIITIPVSNVPGVNEIISTKSEIGSNKDDTDVKIIFVGELAENKGVSVLLESFNYIAKNYNGVKLNIVGDGPMRDYCQRFIKEQNLEMKVNLQGNLPHKDALNQIRSSHFLVLPSESEGLPRSVLEALVLGKTVIASNCGEIPEVVKNGENGILINPKDSNALTQAIIKLAFDVRTRDKLSRNSEKYIRKLPSWEQIANQIIGEYKELYYVDK